VTPFAGNRYYTHAENLASKEVDLRLLVKISDATTVAYIKEKLCET